MSALFNFTSWLSILLLFICASAYLHQKIGPFKFGEPRTQGFTGLWWKAARIGERLSPWVSVCCVVMAFHTLFLS